MTGEDNKQPDGRLDSRPDSMDPERQLAWAAKFEALAVRFENERDASRFSNIPGVSRDVDVALPARAGQLLTQAYEAKASTRFDDPSPAWDLRQCSQTRQRQVFVKLLRLSREVHRIQQTDDPQSSREPVEQAPRSLGGTQPPDDAIFDAASWMAFIRLELAPWHCEFRSDWPAYFLATDATLRLVGVTVPDVAAPPIPGDTIEDRQRNRLHGSADIQATACRILAQRFREEANQKLSMPQCDETDEQAGSEAIAQYAQVAKLLGADAAKPMQLAKILSNKDLSVNERLRQSYELEPAWVENNATWWSNQLKVTRQAVEKTPWWRIERPRLIAIIAEERKRRLIRNSD